MKDNRRNERLIALFLLGMVSFSPITLSIFDVGAHRSVFGIPMLFLYLFGVWAILIGLMALVTERPAHRKARTDATPLSDASE